VAAVRRASGRPAAGGGRWVEVDPDRLSRWLSGFAERHGEFAVDPQPYGLRIRAFDDTLAELHTPPGATGATDLPGFLASAVAGRPLGLLLARRGGVAVGVAHGPELVASKVDSGYVQGRTAAGGWSQQRFARRRDNQSRAAARDAADIAARVLLPAVGRLSALVTGGDRQTVETVLADPRLAPVVHCRAERFLEVAQPRLAVLQAAVGQARTVRIRLIDVVP
jgi:Actinobacteria/chloroflexi VLRF1 release factor